MASPLISIIITAYRYERYVAACIESCLHQRDFSDFEVILVDDGSPDETLDIARDYEPDIKVITQANSGVEIASNQGISHARGQFWVRVDADDLLAPNYLATLAPLTTDDHWAFIYPDYDKIDGNGAVIASVTLPDFNADEVRARGDFLATGTLFRAEAAAWVGNYSESPVNCGLENFELVLKLLQKGGFGIHLAQNLFSYRVHSANMSLTRRQSIIEYGQELAQNFGLLNGYQTNSNHPYGLKL